MLKLSEENRIIDLWDLNRFRIGEPVFVPATAEHDEFKGVLIGIELRRVYASNRLEPCLTLLHDGHITDGFLPRNVRKAMPEGTDEAQIAAWPPLKKALWDVIVAAELNRNFVNAWTLTEQLYVAALEANAKEIPPAVTGQMEIARDVTPADLGVNAEPEPVDPRPAYTIQDSEFGAFIYPEMPADCDVIVVFADKHQHVPVWMGLPHQLYVKRAHELFEQHACSTLTVVPYRNADKVCVSQADIPAPEASQ